MGALTYDNLMAGPYPVITSNETILSGQSVVRGELLGKVELNTAIGATVMAADGGNTGAGVSTIDAATPVLAGAKVGTYTVTCTTAVANLGQFTVSDPNGDVIGLYNVGDTFANEIKFAIADGAADFVVGDFFTVIVLVGSLKLIPCVSTATDGSQNPYGIAGEDIDASLADKSGTVFLSGEYNYNQMTFGGGDTYATHITALRALNIYLKGSVVQ